MRMYRSEIGRINGKYYKLVYDKLGNQQACDTKYHNNWRWFLWVDGNGSDYYEGNFRIKTEAINTI